MVVMEVVAEEPVQVSLVEDDDLVQALAANTPDAALDKRILPGPPRCSEHFFDTHAFKARLEGLAVHAIAIPDQEARRSFPKERFADLVGGPQRGGVLGYVEAHEPAPGVSEDIVGMRSWIALCGRESCGAARR